jgi:hypothetical protein
MLQLQMVLILLEQRMINHLTSEYITIELAGLIEPLITRFMDTFQEITVQQVQDLLPLVLMRLRQIQAELKIQLWE